MPHANKHDCTLPHRETAEGQSSVSDTPILVPAVTAFPLHRLVIFEAGMQLDEDGAGRPAPSFVSES